MSDINVQFLPITNETAARLTERLNEKCAAHFEDLKNAYAEGFNRGYYEGVKDERDRT